MSSTRLLGLMAGAAAVLAAWGIYELSRLDRELNQPPQRIGATVVPSDQVSYINLPIRIDPSIMERISNDAVPSSIDLPREKIWHHSVLGVSISIYGSGTVTRSRPVRISVRDGGVAASTSLRVNYEARLRGVTETARAQADVEVFAAFDIDSSWRPIVSLETSYRWTERPNVELFNRVTVTFGSRVNPRIDEKINELESQLPGKIAAAVPLRQIVADLWRSAFTNREVSPGVWLSVQPTDAYFAKPSSRNGDLLLNLGIAAKLGLSTSKPPTIEPTALPAPQKKPFAGSGVKLAIPLQLDYETISREIRTSLVKKPINLAGKGSITIRDVRIYPAAPRLVLGLNVDADLPDRWFDVRGWVYLYAEPKFAAAEQSLCLADVGFARDIDNAAVRALTAAIRDVAVTELQTRACIDLSRYIEDAVSKVNTYINTGLEDALKKQVSSDNATVRNLLSSLDVSGKMSPSTTVTFGAADNALWVFPVATGDIAVQFKLGK